MRIVLGPLPALRQVQGALAASITVTVAAGLFIVITLQVVVPLVMVAISMIPLILYWLQTRDQPRMVEIRDECLRTQHLRERGDFRTFPLHSITALRLESCRSLFPPRRITALRVHFRRRRPTTLLDEIDCPELPKVFEALNHALKLEDRPADPREAELVESVARARSTIPHVWGRRPADRHVP